MIVINTRFYQKINQHIKSREIAGIVTRSSHVIITEIMTTSQSKEIILSIVHLHNCCLTLSQVTLRSNNQLQRRQYCTTFSRKEHFFGMPYGELTLLVSLCARHYRQKEQTNELNHPHQRSYRILLYIPHVCFHHCRGHALKTWQ